VYVGDLAERFEISSSTIRRDLLQLERKGSIQRIHGGAILPDDLRPTAGSQAATHLSARIGRKAALRVRPGETVYLGPGSLTLEVARALADQETVTVVTNCLEIAHWLARHGRVPVVVTGGAVGRPRNNLGGPLVRQTLEAIRADRVMVEAAGIAADQGLMDADLSQAALVRDLLAGAGESIVLVPPDRVGGVGGVLIAPAGEVDVVVTGREADTAILWDLSQLGIGIVTV
jgi:DeoR/GlpR family transcriptional regulator of sugar metabolism